MPCATLLLGTPHDCTGLHRLQTRPEAAVLIDRKRIDRQVWPPGMAIMLTRFVRVPRNFSRSAHDTTTLAVLMFGWKISRAAPFRSRSINTRTEPSVS